MHLLYHVALCPFSRKTRIVLHEKGVEFKLQVEKVWERRPQFLALNPAGQVPVLMDEDDGLVLAESAAIVEYLEETHPKPALLGGDARARRGSAPCSMVRPQIRPRGDA